MIGPNGEKRPSDPVGAMVRMMQVATKEAKETYVDQAKVAAGKARAAKLTPERRREIAMQGVEARRKAANGAA